MAGALHRVQVCVESFVSLPPTRFALPTNSCACDCRESDLLSSGKCEDYDELETLAEKAHSSLLYLNLQLLGLQDDEQIQFAASHIGVGVGIATLLRGYAHNASLVRGESASASHFTPCVQFFPQFPSQPALACLLTRSSVLVPRVAWWNEQGSLCIPQKVMKQFNLSTKVALSGPSNDEERASLKNATHDMASQAYAQLEAGKKILKQHNGRGLVALLPAVSSVLYLQALEENDFDAFLTSLKYQHEPPLRFLWSLVKARYRGSF